MLSHSGSVIFVRSRHPKEAIFALSDSVNGGGSQETQGGRII